MTGQENKTRHAHKRAQVGQEAKVQAVGAEVGSTVGMEALQKEEKTMEEV